MEFNFDTITISDLIAILRIIVNAVIAVWIARILQNRLADKRTLKNHLIDEVKIIRGEYRLFLKNLSSGKLKPKRILPWFKLMNIKVNDIMEIVHSNYKIDEKFLNEYHSELRNIITEQEEFIANFQADKIITLNDKSLKEIIKFQQKNHSKFNSLIIKINNK